MDDFEIHVVNAGARGQSKEAFLSDLLMWSHVTLFKAFSSINIKIQKKLVFFFTTSFRFASVTRLVTALKIT